MSRASTAIRVALFASLLWGCEKAGTEKNRTGAASQEGRDDAAAVPQQVAEAAEFTATTEPDDGDEGAIVTLTVLGDIDKTRSGQAVMIEGRAGVVKGDNWYVDNGDMLIHVKTIQWPDEAVGRAVVVKGILKKVVGPKDPGVQALGAGGRETFFIDGESWYYK
ncbi:MAG: hypothetical protein IT450_08445 [Phycisphaerales bacterium]|nr:hypothetical protein [Phycisphaerales bacterium]